MRFKLPIISWLNSKYASANAEKKYFKLKATFSEKINFIVKFPISEKHSLIKEFTQNVWEQDIAVINPSNIYLKIFITNINIIKKCNITLELLHIENDEIVASNVTKYIIEKGFNNNEWLNINWNENEINQSVKAIQNIAGTSSNVEFQFNFVEIEILAFIIKQVELIGFSSADDLNFKINESCTQFEIDRRTLREYVKEINTKYSSIFNADELLIYKQKDVNNKRPFKYLISLENIALLKKNLTISSLIIMQ